ncbi:MAG TPA: iron transporter FeoB [Balneolaceae bacterium]|nr:iron transporter FeoB [Balneolaceae bacterium]|tara:strand:- start:12098 stop:12955 length:858 start_codon:yes stop_codon:yes gene_type:complete
MKDTQENTNRFPSDRGLLNKTFRLKQLTKLGVKLDSWDHVIALAGNPNTGKSTVFNSLTGLRQHTGNWPGKTVSRAEGGFTYRDKNYKIVDLPGTYSLLSTSEDEEIARNFILFGQPDVTLIVADATRLERNLNLTLQILEITQNAVLCLNLMDEARRKGISIDTYELSNELGIPVVATTARYGEGIDQLLAAIENVAENPRPFNVDSSINISEELNDAIDELQKDLAEIYPDLPNTRWIALRLLEGDVRIREALDNGELQHLSKLYRQPPLDLHEELVLMNEKE